MRQHLQEQPLSLSQAIQNGWHCWQKDDSYQDCLPQLVNMFVDTEQLQPDLTVAIDPGALKTILPDGRKLSGG